MKLFFDSKSIAVFAVILVLCATFAHSQVSVGMAPAIHFQFFNSSGLPLANGSLYTYQAGTTICQNTYVDASGTTQNPCLIPLDSSGAPSNGSTQTSIFLANTTYKFCAYDSFSVFQWCVDNVSTYFALLNTANTWSAAQTFSSTITDTLTDSQMIFGAPSNQTTVDFPPPASNIILHFPNTSDTLVGRNTTDILANKTLTTPTINSVQVVNGPATYFTATNGGSGTVLNSLVTVTAPTNVAVPSTVATSGVIGIAVAGAGLSGTVTIQAGGKVNCNFDNNAVFGDYVTISSTVAGDCHDAGGTYPINTQAVGRVLANVTGPASAAMDLFPPEVQNTVPQIYNAGGTALGSWHEVSDSVALSGGAATVTFTGNAAFSSASKCTATDATAANAVKASVSGNVLTLAGTGTDTIVFHCIGPN